MERDLRSIVELIVSNGSYKFVFSDLKDKNNIYKRTVIQKINNIYQAERYTEKQVVHKNINTSDIIYYICELINNDYKQCTAWDNDREYHIKISKKGKVLFSKNITDGNVPKKKISNNKQKDYILKEGTVIPPLVDMGIFTNEGKIIKSMYDKYKQINRFLEIIDDEISKIQDKDEFNIIDFGCGKSYFTFILYYYCTYIKNINTNIIGVDLKEDVIKNCNNIAQKYGYNNLKFVSGDIKDYTGNNRIDMVITLHACDTATDYALFNAISWNTNMIFSVPCCQHELNAQIKSNEYSILTRYVIVKERISALFTDAIRANLLECCGYKTQLLEFIDFEHTPKNILIRATKRKNPNFLQQRAFYCEVLNLIKEFNLSPMLYNLLRDNNKFNNIMQGL